MTAPRKPRQTAPQGAVAAAPQTEVPPEDDANEQGQAPEQIQDADAPVARRRRRFVSPIDNAEVGYTGATPPPLTAKPVRTRRFGSPRTEP